MTAEKPNMFKQAAEERRNKFVEDNDHVADEIMATRVDTIEEKVQKNSVPSNSLKKLLIKDNKPTKRQCSYYLDSNIDDFFMRFGEILDVSKSELVNQLLKIAILENEEILEMSKNNKKVSKLLREFNE